MNSHAVDRKNISFRSWNFVWWRCVMKSFNNGEGNGQIYWTDDHSNNCSVFNLWPSGNLNLNRTVWYNTTYNVTTISKYFSTWLTYFPSTESNPLCTLFLPPVQQTSPTWLIYKGSTKGKFQEPQYPNKHTGGHIGTIYQTHTQEVVQEAHLKRSGTLWCH